MSDLQTYVYIVLTKNKPVRQTCVLKINKNYLYCKYYNLPLLNNLEINQLRLTL